MKRIRLSSKTRKRIYAKYDGHCAYCGKEINIRAMQVDHLIPIAAEECRKVPASEIETEENYMPSCRDCNFYKGMGRLETFREMLQTLPSRLDFDIRCRLAKSYGMIAKQKIVFYFEKRPEKE